MLKEVLVCIQDHHPGYITFEEYLRNLDTLERNRTNTDDRLLGGSAREGLALLQGVLICGLCGRRLTVRYTGNGGIYPVYECNWRKREGLSRKACMAVRCDLVDHILCNRTLEILNTDQIKLALETLQELEQRDEAITGQSLALKREISKILGAECRVASGFVEYQGRRKEKKKQSSELPG